MKNFLNTLTFIVGTAATAVLIWGFLYLCIPGVKDNTDKLFKWGDYTETQTEDTNKEQKEDDINAITPAPNAQFVFENDMIKITVG